MDGIDCSDIKENIIQIICISIKIKNIGTINNLIINSYNRICRRNIITLRSYLGSLVN